MTWCKNMILEHKSNYWNFYTQDISDLSFYDYVWTVKLSVGVDGFTALKATVFDKQFMRWLKTQWVVM